MQHKDGVEDGEDSAYTWHGKKHKVFNKNALRKSMCKSIDILIYI